MSLPARLLYPVRLRKGYMGLWQSPVPHSPFQASQRGSHQVRVAIFGYGFLQIPHWLTSSPSTEQQMKVSSDTFLPSPTRYLPSGTMSRFPPASYRPCRRTVLRFATGHAVFPVGMDNMFQILLSHGTYGVKAGSP